MNSLLSALALVSGVVGAGFASGREIICFFAVHGAMAYAAAACALLTLAFLFLRLCMQMEQSGCRTLGDLCCMRLGSNLGRLCSLLFIILCAVTGGAMLCACAEIGALMLPIRHAYICSMIVSISLAFLCALHRTHGLAIPGMLLCILLPVLLVRLLFLPCGEPCFLPSMVPDLPVRAAADGVAYGALNAAMLASMLPMLLDLSARSRRRTVALFTLLFGLLLCLGVSVCRRHMPRIYMQPLPFVFLSRSLGKSGYLLLGGCMFAAAFSTLCAMLCGLQRLLPFKSMTSFAISILLCMLCACAGFGPLISSGYPVLGALCAGLLLILCLPGCPKRTGTFSDM